MLLYCCICSWFGLISEPLGSTNQIRNLGDHSHRACHSHNNDIRFGFHVTPFCFVVSRSRRHNMRKDDRFLGYFKSLVLGYQSDSFKRGLGRKRVTSAPSEISILEPFISLKHRILCIPKIKDAVSCRKPELVQQDMLSFSQL